MSVRAKPAVRPAGSLRLDGKCCIVTGASSGIGAEIARQLASAAGNVVAVGRQPDELRRELATIPEGQCREMLVDLIEPGACQQVVEAALRSYGRLDVIVHSAGVFEPAPFLETTVESYDRQFAVNSRAVFQLTQAAVPHMRSGASIICLSSIASHVGFNGAAAYCMTKGAIELLVKALALELAPRGIRINAVAPGNIHTRMNAHLFAMPGYTEKMLAATPAGRIGEVQDIAPYVVYLASDASEYVHGTSLLIDGGWAAG